MENEVFLSFFHSFFLSFCYLPDENLSSSNLNRTELGLPQENFPSASYPQKKIKFLDCFQNQGNHLLPRSPRNREFLQVSLKSRVRLADFRRTKDPYLPPCIGWQSRLSSRKYFENIMKQAQRGTNN